MKNKLSMLQSVIDSIGIRFSLLTKPYANVAYFDAGIRNQLFVEYDFSTLLAKWESSFEEGKLYLIRDVFEVCYIMFRYESGESDGVEYVSIGPYLQRESPSALEIVEKLDLELYHSRALTDYYNGIAVSANLDQIVYALMQNLFQEKRYVIEQVALDLPEDTARYEIRSPEDKKLSNKIIEERYQCEAELLRAIAQGDVTAAHMAQGRMAGYRMEARTTDSLRDAKNSMVIMNVLCRKAVQEARVHPAHIDEISTAFARRIEASGSMQELARVSAEIIRKYCMLVKNYSLVGYSPAVESALNYIHFHFASPLGLKLLAAEAGVNASYLSAQFKKEVGQTVTDTIHLTRIQWSLVLLATTRLPIQKVAEQSGYLDENYFTKLFKKYKRMTPSAYRALCRE